jgi:hypothetical protein
VLRTKITNTLVFYLSGTNFGQVFSGIWGGNMSMSSCGSYRKSKDIILFGLKQGCFGKQKNNALDLEAEGDG